jgi:hypothetical protein
MGKRLLRRTAIVAAISAAVVGVTTGGVANAKPARGCPTSYQPTAYDPATMPANIDKNGNGTVCVKDTGNGIGNVVDDTSNAGH